MAQTVGFDPVKVNAVAVRGLTEDEIVPFGHFARRSGVDIRFIEFMPLDADNAWQREKVLFAHKIVETLEREIMALVPRPGQDPHAPASNFVFAAAIGNTGFISPATRPSCISSTRFRTPS